MYPFRSYFCIWHLPRLQFNRLNMHAKVGNLFLFDAELMLSFDKKMQSCVSVLQFVVYMTCVFNI